MSRRQFDTTATSNQPAGAAPPEELPWTDPWESHRLHRLFHLLADVSGAHRATVATSRERDCQTKEKRDERCAREDLIEGTLLETGLFIKVIEPMNATPRLNFPHLRVRLADQPDARVHEGRDELELPGDVFVSGISIKAPHAGRLESIRWSVLPGSSSCQAET